MPYQLLTNVTNFDTLLQDVRDFLNATGDWTIHQDMLGPDEDSIASPAAGHQLVVKQGDCLAGLRSAVTGLGADRLYLFDGIPAYSSSDLDSLPGNSGNRYSASDIGSSGGAQARGFQVHPGPFPTAHLYSNDPSTYLHCAVQVSAGVYKHMAFGNLNKFGTWTGGAYYAVSYWQTGADQIDIPNSGSHHVLFDNGNGGDIADWTVHYEFGSDKWISAGSNDRVFGGVQRRAARAGFRGGFGRMFKNIPESTFSGLVPMARVLIQALRNADSPITTRFIGEVPDIRMINITNFAPGDTITIGSDTYMVFPLVAKNGAVDQYNSGNSGIAYKVHA